MISLTMITLPTLVTFTRIFAIPVLLLIIYGPMDMPETKKNMLATIIFVLASLTDWFDGWLARRLNQTSAFGAFLDPVADKLMVCAVLVILVDLERVGAVIGIIIVGREIAVSALREWMLKVGSKRGLKVNMLGKLKTCSQMVALPCLLYDSDILFSGINSGVVGTWLVGLAAILTVISFFNYITIAVTGTNYKD